MDSWGENDWVTIAKFSRLHNAYPVKDFLESEGIQSFIADENMTTLYSIAPIFFYRLQVRARDEEKAKELCRIIESEAEYIYPEGAFPAGRDEEDISHNKVLKELEFKWLESDITVAVLLLILAGVLTFTALRLIYE